MNKRIFALLLCLIMVVSILPVQTFANEADEGLEFAECSYASPDDGTDPEELFTQYASSVFCGSDASSNEAMAGTLAGKQLSGNECIAYNYLVTLFKQVANGQRASTSISFGKHVTYRNPDTGMIEEYPVEEECTFVDREWSDYNIGRVMDAILADLPFEQYWYDKTIGVQASWWYNSQAITQMTFEFVTAEHVRAGNDQFTVNTAKTSAPLKAAANAKAIAAAAEGKSDYEKLVYFRDQVASLTEYNWDAIDESWSYHENNNPWQLIWCFDGDPSTNVVCEGYAKSFMYLCDLTTFRNNITCTTVTGNMWFPCGGGGHMWNIVSIEGKNYIVDVTNSDSGSTGNDTYFLDGGTGSMLSSYYFNGNPSVTFEYHSDMFELWGYGSDSILNLSSTNFDPSSISTEPATPESADDAVIRLSGYDRYDTAFKAADQLKSILGVKQFQNIVVACGTNFPDALAGTYLAAQKQAPMLLVRNKNIKEVNAYIQKNLVSGGTLYLLGTKEVVSGEVGQGIAGIHVKRLGGATRYDTNLEILKEAGITGNNIIVCTGKNFADSLSASAVGIPILLVKDSLNKTQREFLKGFSGKFTIIGGTTAVSDTVADQLAEYGHVERLAGKTRYETSVMVAQWYFGDSDGAVLAYAMNFPDGLSGGPLAYATKSPLILCTTNRQSYVASYTASKFIKRGYVMGSKELISDGCVRAVFSMYPDAVILEK